MHACMYLGVTVARTCAAITKDTIDMTVRNRDGTFPEAAIAAKEQINKCVLLCVCVERERETRVHITTRTCIFKQPRDVCMCVCVLGTHNGVCVCVCVCVSEHPCAVRTHTHHVPCMYELLGLL